MDILDQIDAATGCQRCGNPLGDSPSDEFCSQKCQRRWYAARADPLVGYVEPTDLAAHVHNQVELQSPETTPLNHLGERAVQMITSIRPGVSAWQRDLIATMYRMGAHLQQPARPARGPSMQRLYLNEIRHANTENNTTDRDTVTVSLPGAIVLGFDGSRDGPGVLAFHCGEHVHLAGAICEAMQGMRTALHHAGQVLGQLFPHIQAAAQHQQQEADAKRRALDLRRARNTGPAQAARAPRRIDPRRSR